MPQGALLWRAEARVLHRCLSPISAHTEVSMGGVSAVSGRGTWPVDEGDPELDAVRTRMDWKYALHLPLNGPGFDYTLPAHSLAGAKSLANSGFGFEHRDGQ